MRKDEVVAQTITTPENNLKATPRISELQSLERGRKKAHKKRKPALSWSMGTAPKYPMSEMESLRV